jgi:hypothetical protein
MITTSAASMQQLSQAPQSSSLVLADWTGVPPSQAQASRMPWPRPPGRNRIDMVGASLDYFERRHTPFLVAVNCFDGVQRHSVDAVRRALDLDKVAPVVLCDARDRRSVKDVLIALVEHVMVLTA